MITDNNTYLTARTDTRLSTNDSLLTEFGVLHGPRGQRAGIDAHTKNIDSNFQQLKWTRKLGFQHDVSVQFFHNFHNWHEHQYETVNLPPPVRVYVPLDVSTERYDLELQHRIRPTSNTRLVWGVNSRVDRVNSDLLFTTTRGETYQLNRIFANLEWRITNKLTTNIGAMAEHNNFTGTDFSPRLALNYSLNKHHAFRAVASKAIRVPSVVEERGQWKQLGLDVLTGTRTLKPERIISHELGYHGTYGNIFSVDVKLYRDRVSSLIFGKFFVPFQNTDSATLHGVELQTDYRPTSRDRIFLGYAYTHITSADVGASYSPSAPRHTVSFLGLHHFAHNIDGSLAYYYMGNFKPLDGDFIHRMERLDVRLSKRFKNNALRGRVSLVGESVLGSYMDYQTDNIYQPSMYLSVELAL